MKRRMQLVQECEFAWVSKHLVVGGGGGWGLVGRTGKSVGFGIEVVACFVIVFVYFVLVGQSFDEAGWPPPQPTHFGGLSLFGHSLVSWSSEQSLHFLVSLQKGALCPNPWHLRHCIAASLCLRSSILILKCRMPVKFSSFCLVSCELSVVRTHTGMKFCVIVSFIAVDFVICLMFFMLIPSSSRAVCISSVPVLFGSPFKQNFASFVTIGLYV